MRRRPRRSRRRAPPAPRPRYDAGERAVGEIDLDRRPLVEPERGGALGRPIARSILGGHDVAPQLLPAGDALELAELLERVDPHVRVRADDRADAALGSALDREEAVAEVRLRRRADADAARPHRRAGRARASEACVPWTIVVRGPRQPVSASSSIGRRPCSATHSSISRGCSSAWTCRTSPSRSA